MNRLMYGTAKLEVMIEYKCRIEKVVVYSKRVNGCRPTDEGDVYCQYWCYGATGLYRHMQEQSIITYSMSLFLL